MHGTRRCARCVHHRVASRWCPRAPLRRIARRVFLERAAHAVKEATTAGAVKGRPMWPASAWVRSSWRHGEVEAVVEVVVEVVVVVPPLFCRRDTKESAIASWVYGRA